MAAKETYANVRNAFLHPDGGAQTVEQQVDWHPKHEDKETCFNSFHVSVRTAKDGLEPILSQIQNFSIDKAEEMVYLVQRGKEWQVTACRHKLAVVFCLAKTGCHLLLHSSWLQLPFKDLLKKTFRFKVLCHENGSLDISNDEILSWSQKATKKEKAFVNSGPEYDANLFAVELLKVALEFASSPNDIEGEKKKASVQDLKKSALSAQLHANRTAFLLNDDLLWSESSKRGLWFVPEKAPWDQLGAPQRNCFAAEGLLRMAAQALRLETGNTMVLLEDCKLLAVSLLKVIYRISEGKVASFMDSLAKTRVLGAAQYLRATPSELSTIIGRAMQVQKDSTPDKFVGAHYLFSEAFKAQLKVSSAALPPSFTFHLSHLLLSTAILRTTWTCSSVTFAWKIPAQSGHCFFLATRSIGPSLARSPPRWLRSSPTSTSTCGAAAR